MQTSQNTRTDVMQLMPIRLNIRQTCTVWPESGLLHHYQQPLSKRSSCTSAAGARIHKQTGSSGSTAVHQRCDQMPHSCIHGRLHSNHGCIIMWQKRWLPHCQAMFSIQQHLLLSKSSRAFAPPTIFKEILLTCFLHHPRTLSPLCAHRGLQCPDHW